MLDVSSIQVNPFFLVGISVLKVIGQDRTASVSDSRRVSQCDSALRYLVDYRSKRRCFRDGRESKAYAFTVYEVSYRIEHSHLILYV